MSSIKKRNMTSDIAIKVENLSKVYSLRQPREDEEGNIVYEHKALKDVSFEIKKGESVGIIGPNGSGKSTLLKILAGVIKPSSGKVTIKGRVASILDIGAGFHPELSGRENVFLNGQIHGFTQKEIQEKYDEIVAFSGIEKFINEPVKNYSNGMYLRLAFSIMAHLDFDVYLLDEVLSVGDAEFREKINKMITEVIQKKGTQLIVSHNVSELYSTNKVIQIDKGEVRIIGKSKNILQDYVRQSFIKKGVYSSNITIKDFEQQNGIEDIKLQEVSLKQSHSDSFFRTDKPFKFSIKFLNFTKNEYNVFPILNIMGEANDVLISSIPLKKNLHLEDTKDNFNCWSVSIPANLFNEIIYKIGVTFVKVKLTNDEILSDENEFYYLGAINDIIHFQPQFHYAGFNWGEMNFTSKLIMNLNWSFGHENS